MLLNDKMLSTQCLYFQNLRVPRSLKAYLARSHDNSFRLNLLQASRYLQTEDFEASNFKLYATIFLLFPKSQCLVLPPLLELAQGSVELSLILLQPAPFLFCDLPLARLAFFLVIESLK